MRAAEAHEQLRAFDSLARTTVIETAYPRLGANHTLFINFAPGVVYNPDVCLATTFAACARVGADFSRLVFEVTEAESFPDLDVLRAILEKYRSRGALVALDDLGNGYASLLYLRDPRPDLVKIDRGLITGIHAADPRAGLLASLVDFAHGLGVRVVIEPPGEFEFARRLGTDFAPGYVVGRPSREVRRPNAAAVALWARTQVAAAP